MRIIKLSPKDPDMVTPEMVEHYFTHKLYHRNPVGQFLLTKGRIKADGLYEGESVVFLYYAQIVYLGVVAACVRSNTGEDSKTYPSYFCIDMDSLVRGKGKLSELKQELNKQQIVTPNFMGQGWTQVRPSRNEHLLNNILLRFVDSPSQPKDPPELGTERLAEVNVRIGQSKYREQLKSYWGGCAVTGVEFDSLLVASHIKPWKDSNGIERLDTFNGLLLTPNLDTIFDKGYITFDDTGCIVLSREFQYHAKAFGISQNTKLRRMDPRHIEYLNWHRKFVFRG